MRILFVGLAVALTALAASAQTKRGVFLLDRSGSMTPARVAASLAAIDDDLAKFFQFASSTPTEAIVVEFRDVAGTVFRYRKADGTLSTTPEWLTNGADARAAAAASTTAGGGTKLAQSICGTVVELRSRIETLTSQLFCQSSLFVYSDGGENASTGLCSGPNDANATTGRCPLDFLNAGAYPDVFANSWQRNTCDNITDLITGISANYCVLPSAMVYGRLFNSVTLVPTESEVFRLIRSMAAQTGGTVLQVFDGAPYVPGSASAITVTPIGCRTPSGEMPILQCSDVPRIGSSVALDLAGTGLPLPLMFLGDSLLPQPIQLTALGAPTCLFGINYFVSHVGNFLPLAIPASSSIVGLELYAQGAMMDLSLSPLVTSNVIGLTIQP